MKKTIIALVALSGLAMADSDITWTGNNYMLNSQYIIPASTIGNTSGKIITKTSNNTSPAKLEMNAVFNVTAFGTQTNHLISFGADDGTNLNAYGFGVTSAGELVFGRMGTNNLTSQSAALTYDQEVTVGTLALEHDYALTLVSAATMDASGNPGRGSDNFTITLTDLTSTAASTITKTSTGFGLNGSSFANLRIGSNIANTAFAGTIKTIALPEPATATLSLLALAGLAARRRRH